MIVSFVVQVEERGCWDKEGRGALRQETLARIRDILLNWSVPFVSDRLAFRRAPG